MALFDDNDPIAPAPRRRSRATVVGIWALAVAIVMLLVMTLLPTAYVIEQPGPVYNTLGTVQDADGENVPLIAVEGAETFETAGALDLLTVQVVGSRERTPSWFELAMAWIAPSRAVVPIEQVFPAGQTTEQRNEESSALMVDSQQEATAAALNALDYDIDARLTVHSLTEDSAAEGELEPGDVIVSVDGEDVADAADVRDIVNAKEGAGVEIAYERDGEAGLAQVTPVETESEGESVWLVGVQLMNTFDFPIDVTIQLDNVGGPSAGMMFALGIMDVLTPGELNGGEDVAGTGTITADGDVGPIGGIRQKMFGARDAGAEWFLAPADNCDEVAGNVPGGLRVFSIEELDDAVAVLDAIRDDGDLDALPTCTAG